MASEPKRSEFTGSAASRLPAAGFSTHADSIRKIDRPPGSTRANPKADGLFEPKSSRSIHCAAQGEHVDVPHRTGLSGHRTTIESDARTSFAHRLKAPRDKPTRSLKPNARPSLTARRADRQGAGDPQDATSAGKSQRQAMPSQRKGRKGRPAPKAQNLGRTIKARAKFNGQSAAERKRMRARACR